LLFIQMWVRWTLPRFRFDQLMKLAWRGLIPLMIVMMVVVGLMTWMGQSYPWMKQWWAFALVNIAVTIAAALISPMLPSGPPINRRVPLAGSRYSPLEQTDPA